MVSAGFMWRRRVTSKHCTLPRLYLDSSPSSNSGLMLQQKCHHSETATLKRTIQQRSEAAADEVIKHRKVNRTHQATSPRPLQSQSPYRGAHKIAQATRRFSSLQHSSYFAAAAALHQRFSSGFAIILQQYPFHACKHAATRQTKMKNRTEKQFDSPRKYQCAKL